MKLHYFTILILTSLLFACKDNSNSTKTSTATIEDVLGSHIDTTVHPGDDFFNYANGGWLKNNPIPNIIGYSKRYNIYYLIPIG